MYIILESIGRKSCLVREKWYKEKLLVFIRKNQYKIFLDNKNVISIRFHIK